MRKIDINAFMEFAPCKEWPQKRVQELYTKNKQEVVTLKYIADNFETHILDKFGMFLKFLSDEALQKWSNALVKKVITETKNPLWKNKEQRTQIYKAIEATLGMVLGIATLPEWRTAREFLYQINPKEDRLWLLGVTNKNSRECVTQAFERVSKEFGIPDAFEPLWGILESVDGDDSHLYRKAE